MIDHKLMMSTLNLLQNNFVQMFSDRFPDQSKGIVLEPGIMSPNNFCFSITSPSILFGKLKFDISQWEITVFSSFDHKHFNVDPFESDEDIQLICESTLEYVSDMLAGNIIIEFKQQGDKIIHSVQYLISNPDNPFSTTIMASNKSSALITNFKINWFGLIE